MSQKVAHRLRRTFVLAQNWFPGLLVTIVLLATACGGAVPLASLEPRTMPSEKEPASDEPSRVDAADPSALSGTTLGQHIRFEHISVEQGLSENSVHCILQDSQGFMWFGTQDGLNKYNGYGFTAYKTVPGLNSLAFNIVRAIYEDPSGVLWVGTYGGGLDKFDRKTQRFTHYRNDPRDSRSLSHNYVTSIHADQSGELWIGTLGGLNRLDPETGHFTRYLHDDSHPGSLGNNRIWSVYRDREGVLWIGTEGGLDRGDPERQRFIHYQNDPDDPGSLSGHTVWSIYQDREGVLWVGTDGGLNRFDRQTEQFTHYQHDPDDPTSLSSNSVQAIYQDRESILWIGTDDGLDRFDRDKERFVRYKHELNDPTSLSSNWVWSIYQDREGVLWVGTYNGGLNKFDRSTERFVHYRAVPNDPNSLSSNQLWTIFEDQEGNLWIGTNGQGLNKFDRQKGQFTLYQHDPNDPHSLSHNVVRSVYEDREGVLWIGTDGGGLDKFDRHKEQFIHYQNDPNDPYSLSDNTIRTLFEDRQGTLWIGTYRGGLNKFDRHRERFIRYQYDPNDPHSLRSNSIWSIYEDREGVLWVGAAGSGLHEFDRDKEQFTCYPPGTGGNIILSIYQDRSGALWIGTYGEGLAKFDREKRTFTTFRERDGLPSDAIYGILEDDRGFLWLSTNNGLSKFDPQTEDFRNYDVSDGLQSKEFRTGAYHKSKSGEMFFGGINGFNAFYPDSISEDNPYIPPVVLTSFTQGGEPVDVNAAADRISEFTLGWPNNFFEFEFAALSYSRPEKNQYAYMLEGFDKDWSYVGTRRFERYTNLPGGTYTLKIKGSNGDGVWNEEGIAVRITVLPAFWETWTFRVIVAVVVVAAAVGIYRQRFRSIEERSHELEALVEERTHEIEQRRQVAEGLRDILAVLNSNRPLDDILDYIVAQAGRLMGSGATVLHHLEHKRQLVAIQASSGLPDELASIEGIPFYATGADEAILNRQPYAIQDLQVTETVETDGAKGDPQAERWLAATRQHYRSFLAVPLTVEGEVYRCMAFYYAEPQTFSDEKIGLAVALADQAALAIENARLRDQVEEAAVAAERSRLARDLHDSVTQSLYSSTLLAEAGQRLARAGDVEHAEGYLSRLGDITQQALKEMRLLVYQLRPLALRQEGLAGALQRRLDAVERRAGVEAHLVVEGEVELPAAVEEDVYRIAQEALNNALKHAAPSLVVVNVRVEGRGTVQRVVLEVVDDGRGFDPQAVSVEGGMGLVNMQERAEKLGGTLTIVSTPGEGTKVSVSVKVSARAGSHRLQEVTK